MHLGSNRMAPLFYAFGTWLYRRRFAVVVAWAVIVFIAFFGAARAPEVLRGSAAGIPNSSSARAQDWLRTEFKSPYRFPFIVTAAASEADLDDEAFQGMLAELQGVLSKKPYVIRTFSYLDRQDARFRSSDGHRTFLILGIDASSFLDAEQRVPETRREMAAVASRWQERLPGLEVHLTGEIPIGYDATRMIAKDTTTAEHRILPLALAFLLFAFGAVAAAGIPVLLGALASVTTLGLLFVVGQGMNLSSMAQNITAMVGLGIGIDYALIMVTRFREALHRRAGDVNGVEAAVGETVSTSGVAVLYSGLTVMISFLALFLPDLIDTTSLAMAGSLTVLAAVLLCLTLVPALLGILGPRIDWPAGFSRWVAGMLDHQAMWYRWARTVMRNPMRFLGAGVILMLFLSLPAMTVEFGQFGSKFLPADMDSGQGLRSMEAMGQAGEVYPIQLLVRRKDGRPITDPASLKALKGVTREFAAEPVVKEVRSIVQFAGRLLLLSNVFYSGDTKAVRSRFPEAVSLLLSEDASGTVIQVVPRNDAAYKEIKAFVRELQRRDWSAVPGFANLEVAIGGPSAVNNDFEYAILSNFPYVVALVFGVTFILLAWSFRSLILPLKALAMNTLSTLASFGALVLVFQHGYLIGLVGYSEAPGNILVPIPIIVFCLVFGLSMDYEVFLLSRIQEEYLVDGDNERAVATGLAATGGIITNAALIMLLVFGAFAAASVVLTKMLGFGLAVAIVLDALIIRVMLVPSFMALMGKWNWWPNILPRADVDLKN
ncbi:MAG: efflux RND transporter permease subunit [Candidatus Sericytochromatia bacterium]|nr:efflux RND transporter permease subunit [Candidatus Sericytochromatia bacterium]